MPAKRTYYELLSVDPDADRDAIKAAFRLQVARYHPDKVVHLGEEFQDLAVQKTAELTTAYTTLMDEARRREYDQTLARVPGPRPRFAAERAGGDDIVQRALVGRVRTVVVDLYGDVQTRRVRGFDLVLVPTTSPPLMGSPFPRVFVRLKDAVAPSDVTESGLDASRARLHVPGSPINVLLFGKRLSHEADILLAGEHLRRDRRRDVPEKTWVVVIDASDWRALVGPDAPPGLRRLIDRLRA